MGALSSLVIGGKSLQALSLPLSAGVLAQPGQHSDRQQAPVATAQQEASRRSGARGSLSAAMRSLVAMESREPAGGDREP
jgi:hypothetical protein